MSVSMGFGDQLATAMAHYGPLCVGVDPHPALLGQWGLEDSAKGLEAFSAAVLEAAQQRVALLKPQVALFERHGSAGVQVLENLLAEAARHDLLVVADAKRGDIGSTMQAYASAWLGEKSALSTDSVTLSPYLGFESLRPAFDMAQSRGKGVFVLALTSNPEGASVQHLGAPQSVAAGIIAAARQENERVGFETMGPCGLVVGATVGDALTRLGIDLSTFNGPILAPGYGAQGASAKDLYAVFEGIEEKVAVNSSRGILSQGPSVQALIEAIENSNLNLKQALKK